MAARAQRWSISIDNFSREKMEEFMKALKTQVVEPGDVFLARDEMRYIARRKWTDYVFAVAFVAAGMAIATLLHWRG